MVRRRDGVILLHGIGMSSWTTRVAGQTLREAGYRTLKLDTAGRRLGLAALAAHVHEASVRWIAGCDGEVHCLTHPMGGLVTRVLLATRRPANLGRVVMLGPPNSGSEIADLLARYALHRRVFDPAGIEPITRGSPALTSLLGEVDYPVGASRDVARSIPSPGCSFPSPTTARSPSCTRG